MTARNLAQEFEDGAESLAEVPGGLGLWVDLLREAATVARREANAKLAFVEVRLVELRAQMDATAAIAHNDEGVAWRQVHGVLAAQVDALEEYAKTLIDG